MEWVNIYSTTDNISRPFRDYLGYIWLYKWDGDHRILRSTTPNGSTFEQKGTMPAAVAQICGDTHGRVFFVASSGVANIRFWDGAAFATFGSETVAYIAIGPDDAIYSINSTTIKKCVYGSTSFSAYSTSPYSSEPIFIDQDSAVYAISSSEKKVQKMPVGGSFADIGADAIAWQRIYGGLHDGRKFLQNTENDFLYRALDGSDAFDQYIEITGLSTKSASADYFGNLFTYQYSAPNFIVYGLKYGVTYDGNGADSGSAPVNANLYYAHDGFTAAANSGSLVKAGYLFAGWNTAADGSGTRYAPGATITMTADDLTLYAEWIATITYNSNGAVSGTAPVDTAEYHPSQAATAATNSGSLARPGKIFAGWNTAADGSGTHYDQSDEIIIAGDLLLYAEWTELSFTKMSGRATASIASVNGTAAAGIAYINGYKR